MMSIVTKIKGGIRKNYPEIKALLSGKCPEFVYGKKLNEELLPVFVFHEIDPYSFEEKLIYLKENGYETLDADELLKYNKKNKVNKKKCVVLTFDDGHISLWQHAYLLLKKYNYKAVSFICPGLVPGEEKEENINKNRKLCNWQEIIQMHNSGHVDFQSNSMYHDLVFTSSKLVGFYNPPFSSYYLGKNEKAVVLKKNGNVSITNLLHYEYELACPFFGMPIFELAPKLATSKRFNLAEEVQKHFSDFLRNNSDISLLKKDNWGKALNREFSGYRSEELGESISASEYQGEVALDLKRSKEIIEGKLSGKKVQHICFPWFETKKECLETALKCGYLLFFLGEDACSIKLDDNTLYNGVIIQRLPEEYIFLLPGSGRKNIFSIFFGSKNVKRC